MIKLSQILKESQDKVSSAVEQQLRKEGVTVEAQSSPSELGSEGSALQQAGLGRIEDLLGAILSRLETGEQAMPEMLHEPRLPPHQEQPEQDSPAENVQFSSKSVSTVSEGELLALRDKPSYQPKSRDISAQSSPRSEGYIVKERKKTMEKLQSVRSPSDLHSQNPRANENSHWSADVSTLRHPCSNWI